MKEILLSDDQILILLELVYRVTSEGLNLIEHPSELEVLWELEGSLEKNCDTILSEKYKEFVNLAKQRKSSSKLIKIDLEEIRTKIDLLELLANIFKFPNYFRLNWEGFDECLKDSIKDNWFILILNKKLIDFDLIHELKNLESSIENFNKRSENQISIFDSI